MLPNYTLIKVVLKALIHSLSGEILSFTFKKISVVRGFGAEKSVNSVYY